MTLASFVLDSLPFPRGTMSEVLPWILKGARPSIGEWRPDLPPLLSGLIGRLIAADAEARPQTATQLKADRLYLSRNRRKIRRHVDSAPR